MDNAKIAFEILSAILGVLNLIQFIVSLASGASLRAKAQASFNDWFRVAEVADIISKDPTKAAGLIRNISGFAEASRNEIKAYSLQKLGFIPSFEPAYQTGTNPPKMPRWWTRFGLAFLPK
jgi:hypothetical protein